MGAFPGAIVRESPHFQIVGSSREREHGDWFAHPHAVSFQVLLPGANVTALIVLGQDQIALNPWNPGASVDKQFAQPVSAQPAILIELVAALVGDGFNAAFHRDAVGAAQQVEAVFVPEIDARLQADRDLTVGKLLQKAVNIASYPENLIYEVDVRDASRNQGIDFLQNGVHIALAILVAEQRLVAERAGPRTSSGKLEFGASP